MSFNWITIVLITVVLFSGANGIRRRFAGESRIVVFQVISVVSGLIAIWAGWFLSHTLSAFVLHQSVRQLPSWLGQVLVAWQRAPQVAMWITFSLLYLGLSAVLHRVLERPALFVVRHIPARIGASRWLGAGVGSLAGVVRSVALGALVFLALQYFSIPQLTAQAKASSVYRTLANALYKPWLKPLVSRELPVLAEGALSPIAANINLFAVPTGVSGEERGVLIVPAPIAAKAQEIVSQAHANSAKEKAYALYEWEIHNVNYDWKKYNDFVSRGQWDEQSPMQTLQTHKGVCADYALLYADMAHAVGLSVEIIEGIGGTQQENGPHAWNAVFNPTTGQWMMVDTTWGNTTDAWFDVPITEFSKMHIAQKTIIVDGNRS